MIKFAALFLFAVPFWETKAPVDWTEQELQQLLNDSPWAQTLDAPTKGGSGVQIFLATSAPIEQAERQWDLRFTKKRPNAQANNANEEYQAWLAENRAKQIIIAVLVNLPQALSDEQEVHRMEEECVMRVGRKKFKMSGFFPPTAADRYLRLAFPREVTANDKTVLFDLYLPGVPIPFRQAEFKIRDMLFKGKLEM
jgi:hypothetical protein